MLNWPVFVDLRRKAMLRVDRVKLWEAPYTYVVMSYYLAYVPMS